MKKGRPIKIPATTPDEVPPGLCWYELHKALGLTPSQRNIAKAWCFYTGYMPIDGRTKYTARAVGEYRRVHPIDHYRQVLTDGKDTKTLEELGQELGITRERVRQLYIKFEIERRQRPHTAERVSKLKGVIESALVQNHPSVQALARAIGVSHMTVKNYIRDHNLPFKSALDRKREQEAMGFRTCTGCKQEKRLEDFYAGYRYNCKTCVRIKQAKWRVKTGKTRVSLLADTGTVYIGKPYDPVKDLPWPHGYARCSTCRKVKLWEDFAKYHRSPTGHTKQCKECKSEYDRKRRNKMNDTKTKRCTKCGRTKSLDEFYNNSAKRGGKMATCKPCHNEVVKRAQAKAAAEGKLWARNPYKAKLRNQGAPIPPDPAPRPKTLPSSLPPQPTQPTFGLSPQQLQKLRNAIKP